VIRRDLSEERAVEAVSALRRATIARVDEPLALEAADLSLAHGLAMADSLVYATARRFGATLVTGDTDFEGSPTRSWSGDRARHRLGRAGHRLCWLRSGGSTNDVAGRRQASAAQPTTSRRSRISTSSAPPSSMVFS
jgi:hypothetical protein